MSALILRFIDSLCFVESSISHQGERKKNLLPLHHPPHQPRQHLPRAAFYKLRHAIGEHVLHALRPTDGGGELLQEVVFNLLNRNIGFVNIQRISQTFIGDTSLGVSKSQCK